MPMHNGFDGYIERSAKVSSTCLVTVARNRYSVPCELAGQRVSNESYRLTHSTMAAKTRIKARENSRKEAKTATAAEVPHAPN